MHLSNLIQLFYTFGGIEIEHSSPAGLGRRRFAFKAGTDCSMANSGARHCMIAVAQPKKATVIGRGCALLGMYGTRYPLHDPNLLVTEAVWTDDRLCHETVAERELTMSYPRCFLHLNLTLVSVGGLPLRVLVGGLGQWLSSSKGAMRLQPRLPVQVTLRAQVRLPMRVGWYSHTARFTAHR